MRAAAITLVIVAHYAGLVVPRESLAYRLLDPLGVVGVELFFVLSGFLIGGILMRSLTTRVGGPVKPWAFLREFWWRRWLRTLPNYYLFLLVAVALEFATGAARPDRWAYPLFLQNWAWTADPNTWNVASGYFDVTWSLACEEWFYLLLPVALLAACRLLRDRTRAIAAMLGVVIVGSWVARLTWAAAPDWDAGIRKVVLLRLDSFAYGMAVAFAYEQLAAKTWRRLRALVWVGLAAILAGWAWVGFDHSAPAIHALVLPWLDVASACLIPALVAMRPPRVPAIRAFVEQVSRWSYSLYLCHALFISVTAFMWPGLLEMAWLRACVCLSAAVVLALMVYRFYEQPWMRLRDRT